MNLKQLKPKLNFIKKNARPILTMVKVTKNSLEVNDLETYVTIKYNHGLSEGYVYLVPKLYPDNQYVIGAYTGDDFELGFNFDYLVRAANKDKSFKIKFNNLLNPCEVNGSIVMPLKL